MNLKEIHIKNQKEWVPIIFDLERPFLKVIDCFAVLQNNSTVNGRFDMTFQIHYSDGRVIENPRSFQAIKKERDLAFASFSFELNEATKLLAMFEYQTDTPDYSHIVIRYEPMEYLEMNFPGKQFEQHLKDPKNTKILFSAPYGQGKSTFIDMFFKTKFNEYNVFRVFPVNYSVASNEDIFRYIKSDILSQLLLKDVEFDINDISYSQAFIKHVKNDPVQVFAPFLQSIPKVGKQIYDIFEQVRKKVFQDDKKEATEFINEIYLSEGGIYEDNFFTQLIRHLLDKFQAKQGGQNVLVIDDLDRMDPEHIFRILNVISAHYDTYRLLDDQDHNKFGFDKIIVVCDINNIRHIFQHRYGSKTHFEGYINKFYSTEIFHYKNKEVYVELIKSFTPKDLRSGYRELYRAFEFIAKCFIETNQLSLREILKLQNFPLWNIKEEIVRLLDSKDMPYFMYALFTPIIRLFTKLFSFDSLIYRFEICKKYEFEIGEREWGTNGQYAMVGVATRINRNSLKYPYKNGEIGISVDLDSFYYVKGMDFYVPDTGDRTSFGGHFTQEEFFEFLIENTNRLEQVT